MSSGSKFTFNRQVQLSSPSFTHAAVSSTNTGLTVSERETSVCNPGSQIQIMIMSNSHHFHDVFLLSGPDYFSWPGPL